MKRILLPAIGLFAIAASLPAATFFTRDTQGQVNTWASIWTNASQMTKVAPTAGGVNDQAAAPVARTSAAALADVAEPAYAPVSETGDFGHEGSTPSVRTCLRSTVPP